MSIYKNQVGAYLLRGLFYETTLADKSTVVYTLKDEDHEGYPSLKRLYLSYEDPTEYQFAINHLYGVEHWQKLCECTWFKPYAEQWRNEFELRMKSAALARVMEDARSATKTSFSSNKFLLEKGWIPKENSKSSVGRPTKEAIKEQAELLVRVKDQYDDDAKRLGLN